MIAASSSLAWLRTTSAHLSPRDHLLYRQMMAISRTSDTMLRHINRCKKGATRWRKYAWQPQDEDHDNSPRSQHFPNSLRPHSHMSSRPKSPSHKVYARYTFTISVTRAPFQNPSPRPCHYGSKTATPPPRPANPALKSWGNADTNLLSSAEREGWPVRASRAHPPLTYLSEPVNQSAVSNCEDKGD